MDDWIKRHVNHYKNIHMQLHGPYELIPLKVIMHRNHIYGNVKKVYWNDTPKYGKRFHIIFGIELYDDDYGSLSSLWEKAKRDLYRFRKDLDISTNKKEELKLIKSLGG